MNRPAMNATIGRRESFWKRRAGLAVSCDQDRVREAVDNLISNAVKYSPNGGSIAVAVERLDRDAVIRVRDSGPGLSPEDNARLFGRFQRLSAKPTAGESWTRTRPVYRQAHRRFA